MRSYLMLAILAWGSLLQELRALLDGPLPEECPVILKSNHSNICECSSEITCDNLDAIPEFTSNGRVYRVLDLRRQQIDVMPEHAFFSLQVEKIALDFNPIESRIDENALFGLEEWLLELSLASCGVVNLPPKFLYGMRQLRHLYLWNNAIKIIPIDLFEDAGELIELSLWGNRIKALHVKTFSGLHSLQRLDLDHNRINQLNGDVFKHLGNLEALHLGHNRIHALHKDTFSPLKKLRILNLDHNGLQFMYTDAFNSLGNLLSLSLDHNSIDLLTKDVFTPLKKLNHLFLHHNKLANSLWAIHLSGLQSLLSLDLSSNEIRELPGGMFRFTPDLRQLRLDHNELSNIPASLFLAEKQLLALSVLDNPLQCVCDMAWVADPRGFSVWGSCRNATGQLRPLADPSTFADHC
jgi:Leucine-rich repeat (LRR) protein